MIVGAILVMVVEMCWIVHSRVGMLRRRDASQPGGNYGRNNPKGALMILHPDRYLHRNYNIPK